MPFRLVPLSAHDPGKSRAASGPARDALMQSALALLSRRARSAAEVEHALAARGAPKRLVREVLGRLRDLGYIDDRTFAAERSERLLSRGYGAERIRAELERSGIDEKTIEATVPPLSRERERAKSVLRERFADLGALRGKRRAQAVRWLAARGFREEILEEWSDAWTD